MKRNCWGFMFFVAMFMASSCFADSELNESNSQDPNFDHLVQNENFSRQRSQQKNNKKKECNYVSKCRCCDYKTCCAMLPLPVNRNGHMYVEGEYLYWKTYALFPYIVKRLNVTPFIANAVLWDTDVKSVELDPSSGYRLNLGFYLSNCWSLRSTFRQYDADGKDAFTTTSLGNNSVPHGEQIGIIWTQNEPFGNDSEDMQVSSRQRYREKVWDIDFARNFSCNRFTLNSFIGVRFAWVKNDSSINTRVINDPDGNFNLQHTDINNRFNLGVGLHVGMDTQMDLPWGFGFYGNSQIAALIGQFKYKMQTYARTLNVGNHIIGVSGEINKVTDFQTNWSLGTGLNWGHHFSDCGYYLGFKLGYEVNVWPNFITVNQFSALGSDTTQVLQNYWRRSVLTHGLVLSARFDF